VGRIIVGTCRVSASGCYAWKRSVRRRATHQTTHRRGEFPQPWCNSTWPNAAQVVGASLPPGGEGARVGGRPSRASASRRPRHRLEAEVATRGQRRVHDDASRGDQPNPQEARRARPRADVWIGATSPPTHPKGEAYGLGSARSTGAHGSRRDVRARVRLRARCRPTQASQEASCSPPSASSQALDGSVWRRCHSGSGHPRGGGRCNSAVCGRDRTDVLQLDGVGGRARQASAVPWRRAEAHGGTSPLGGLLGRPLGRDTPIRVRVSRVGRYLSKRPCYSAVAWPYWLTPNQCDRALSHEEATPGRLGAHKEALHERSSQPVC